MNPELDARFRTANRWRFEGERLRNVLLDCGLTEELKWGKPCYTASGKNIVIIQRMKDFLALMFFKGALLKDSKDVLKEPGANSHSARRMELTSVQEVATLEPTIRAYVREAIELEKSGRKVPRTAKLVYVDELAERLPAARLCHAPADEARRCQGRQIASTRAR